MDLQGMQDLEKILKQEIIPEFPPPYDSARKLSQITLRLRQEYETGRLNAGSVQPEDFFLYLYFIQEGFELIGTNPSGFDMLRRIDDFDLLKRSLIAGNDSQKASAEEFGGGYNEYEQMIISEIRQKDKNIARMEIEKEVKRRVEQFQAYLRQLKQPTEGLLNPATNLEYTDLGEGVKLLCKASPSILFRLTGKGELLKLFGKSKGSSQEEDNWRLDQSVERTIGEDPEEFRVDLILSQFLSSKRQLSESIQAITRPTILNFPHYNFCDSVTHPGAFVKWINPERVKLLDDEIYLSQELRKLGLSTTNFTGYVLSGDNAYLLGEKIEGIDFAKIRYSEDLTIFLGDTAQEYLSFLQNSFPGTKITPRFWKEQTAKAYRALGREMRKLTETHVYCPDLAALRNSMLTYVNGEPQVTFVDYERIELREPTSEEKADFLAALNLEFKSSRALEEKHYERKQFQLGFEEQKV